ncbi:hypothetical protein DITRI_Ditri06bG0073700 [Diplodiscus trichospermus]
MNSVNSPISYAIDEKDLDEAALWAVIDSAAASHSSKHRKTLMIKYPNHQSSPTPVSHWSPPGKFPQQKILNPSHQLCSPPKTNNRNLANEGEDYRRPSKMEKSCASEVSETSPMAVVRRNPITPSPEYRSPEMYLSPGFRGVDSGNGSEVSPGSCGRSEEKEGMRHSLSGKFPSVEVFKEYQNAAMAILEKSDYTMISGSPFIKKSGNVTLILFFTFS